MEIPDDTDPTGARTPGAPATGDPSAVADSAMATGTDDEPDMTIADKHAGETPLDLNGDGELTPDEAAVLLGDQSGDDNKK